MNLKLPISAAMLCLSAFTGMAKDGLPAVPGNSNLYFLENNGQITDQNRQPRTDIQFVVPSKGVNVFIGDAQIHYQFSHVQNPMPLHNKKALDLLKPHEAPKVEMYRMDVKLLGANQHATVVTEDKLDMATRYCQPQTSRGFHRSLASEVVASSYRKITYKDVYTNIDWVIYSKGDALEYEFVVRPGGNPADIRLEYGGTTALAVTTDGGLHAETPMGSISEHKPVSYQADGKEVASSFNLQNNVLTFNVAQYNGTLTIDPTLTWGTYFGGFDTDEYDRIQVDGSGNVYVLGTTTSTGNIATVGANQTVNNGGYDMMLSKFSSSGNLLWSTYYGTFGEETAQGIAINGSDVFFVGSTDALGNYDGLLGKFSTSGNYDSDGLIGYSGDDILTGITTDAAGDVYLCGLTSSYDLPTFNAHQSSLAGSYDGFVASLTNDLLGGYWLSYYGGYDIDVINDITVDASGDILFTGYTASISDVSTTSSPAFGGGIDGFVAKFDVNGVRQWGTYTGGNDDDEARAIAVDASGNSFISGKTLSISGLATSGAYQTTNQGGVDGMDAFVVKFNSTGTKQWGTYYGGNQDESSEDIAVIGTDIVVVGSTQSTTSIATAGAYDATLGGMLDGYIAKFSTSGTLVSGSYYGGSNEELILNVAADASNNIYLIGTTTSTTGIASTSGYKTNLDGPTDAFLAKLQDCILADQPVSLSGDITVCTGSSNTYTVPAVPGATSYQWTLPTGFTGTSTTNTITVSAPATAGSGTLSVQAINSCGLSIALTQAITVTATPTVSITTTAVTSFSATLTTTTLYSSYQWYQDSVVIPGATSQTYYATQSANYYVVVSDGVCDASSNSLNLTVTGINDVNTLNTLFLYPNPTTGHITLQGEIKVGHVDMVVTDVTGRVVYSQATTAKSAALNHTLDVSSLPSGMYMIKIMTKDGNQVIPFVAQ